MRITKEEMKATFVKILTAYGFSPLDAEASAEIFVQNSLDGVYSHGVNRFTRVLAYITKGYINPQAYPSVEGSFGSIERWDGNLGMGNLSAQKAMGRAIVLAKEFGVGCVAMRNTNHWMRGGTYGWQAADAGCIGLCFTNTLPNMPPWGAREPKIGNNPFVLAIPRENGHHVVVDTAMAQFSYGKMEEAKLRGENLPFPGGFDTEGNLSTDPAAIEESLRVLPIGYWKGSSLAIAFDLIAAVLSGGNSTSAIGKQSEDEFAISQVFIAIDPYHLTTKKDAEQILTQALNDLKLAEPIEEGKPVHYPGERTYQTRIENTNNGIPVNEAVWKEILDHLEKTNQK